MSTSTTTAIAENRTIFDGRSISEEELEVTESGNYALYIAERTEMRTDEVHVFSMRDRDQNHSQVFEKVRSLTGDSNQSISKVKCHFSTDGRLVLSIKENQTPEDRSSGQELATHLLSDDEC